MQGYDARRGTVVRVRNGHWKSQFAGMNGAIQNCWGHSEYAAVDVLLEDGRSELFWLPDLAVVDEDIKNLTVVQEGERTRVRLLSKYHGTMPEYVS